MKENSLPSDTQRYSTGCGGMFVTFVYDPDSKYKIDRVLVQLGKTGTCARAHLEAFTALASTFICEDPKSPTLALALTRASGHICEFGEKSCVNVLSRILLDHVTKLHNGEKEDEPDED